MNISDFDYELPPGSIAQEPLAERDASRLLVLQRDGGRRSHHAFRDLPGLLEPGDLVVVNRSRVLHARLYCQRESGGRVELLLLRRLEDDAWEAWARPGGRLKPGETLISGTTLRLQVESEPLEPDGRRRVRPECSPGAFLDHLEEEGHVPLPPYIRRDDGAADRDRYQTVYAREPGSVAAPTAGLHFTPRLLDGLRNRGAGVAEIVLHVGPGTFQPVRVERVGDHRVEAEPYEIPVDTAQAIRDTRERGGRVVAVGTTVVRTLETAALREVNVRAPSPRPSPRAVRRGVVRAGNGATDLVIVPGFEFRVVDALVTNFHLPKSSLLLLVAAFAGRERILETYAEAIEKGYRFYSYGDAILIL